MQMSRQSVSGTGTDCLLICIPAGSSFTPQSSRHALPHAGAFGQLVVGTIGPLLGPVGAALAVWVRRDQCRASVFRDQVIQTR
jgi:hypothetical protein